MQTCVLVGQEHTDDLQSKAMNALLPLVCSLYQVDSHSITQSWAQWIIGYAAYSVQLRIMGVIFSVIVLLLQFSISGNIAGEFLSSSGQP